MRLGSAPALVHDVRMDSEARRQAAVAVGRPEWADLPASWSDAEALTASGWPEKMPKHFFTAKPCKYGHVSVRRRGDGRCSECDRAYNQTPARRAYDKTPARRERRRAYNKTPVRRELDRAYQRAYKKTPAMREQEYVYNRTPARQAYQRAFQAHRRALKLKATPRWLTPADHEAMRLIYGESARLTIETGILHHVDHVVPLHSKCPITRRRNATGFHCPQNLRIVSSAENLSKGCYYSEWLAVGC